MTLRIRAIVGSLLILGFAVAAGLWRYAGANPKPVVESRRIEVQNAVPAGPTGPTAREVLERRNDLRLTKGQVDHLAALDREWRQSVGPLETRVRESAEEFQRFMADSSGAGRTNLGEIQRRTAEQGELFAAYRAGQRAHSSAVQAVLTEEQRARWTAMTASGHTRE